MELSEVLRHSGGPRTEYFLDIPTRYGNLRLDIHAPVDVALTRASMSAEEQQAVDDAISEARAASSAGNMSAAIEKAEAVASEYPYSPAIYEALVDLYQVSGDRAEAEYNFKQVIALQPTYRNLMLFGKFLGRSGRLEEAKTVERHLWDTRSEVPGGLSLEAVHDYLVTLSRIPDGALMVEVAAQAVQEYGGETTLLYQEIYGYILSGREQQALAMLNTILPRLDGRDPLFPRFQQMLDYLHTDKSGT